MAKDLTESTLTEMIEEMRHGEAMAIRPTLAHPSLLHEAVPALKKAFPNATDFELYSASITINVATNTVTYRCGGKEHIEALVAHQ